MSGEDALGRMLQGALAANRRRQEHALERLGGPSRAQARQVPSAPSRMTIRTGATPPERREPTLDDLARAVVDAASRAFRRAHGYPPGASPSRFP